MGIIIITHEKQGRLIQSRQNPIAPAKRNAQSWSQPSAGPDVFGGELFRSTRSDPGQIRNAATSAEGQDADHNGSQQFRFLSSGFLQSPARFYARRLGRTYSQTTRPQRRAQVDLPGGGVCRAITSRTTVARNTRVVKADSEKVWRSSASPNSGASSSGREKKTAHTIAVDSSPLLPAAMLSEQYEILREYVLLRNGTHGLRLGEGVLRARGMVAWMQVVGELIPQARSMPAYSGEAVSMPPQVQDEMIQLMGQAVLSLLCRGASL
jgi:hypothetical protein